MKTITPETYDTWDSFTWKLFGGFLGRMGWTVTEIAFEINLLKVLGFNTSLREVDMKTLYYPASRIGATRKIPRKARMGIILTYENAANHASIHFRD